MLSDVTGWLLIKVLFIVAVSWLPFKVYDFFQVTCYPGIKDKIKKEAKEKAKRTNYRQGMDKFENLENY